MFRFSILAIMAIMAIFSLAVAAISGYPPFLSTETLSEPYLGLISGGATPTPSAPQIHPEYTLDASFIAPPVQIPGAR